MRKFLITGVLLLAATPAIAGWAKTNWGMTPAQVVAVTPGAVIQAASDDTDLMGMHQLAEAKLTEGKVKLTAGFYFKPDTNGLAMVDLVADDNTQCADYRKALTARLGPGEVTHKEIKVGDYDLVQVSIEWKDTKTGDEMIFAGVFMDEAKTEYALCKLMHWGPDN